jgi:NAD(P)-dependent dehydrogenase (short-subunit alcohol dehydrogenase family)
MAYSFEGKVALVTAAAAGIGAATATRLARDGARVMLSDIDAAGGEALAEQLRADGADARFIRADVTREDEVAALVRATVEHFGGLDIAANIVGDSMGDANGTEMHLKSVEGWDDTFAVCLRSAFLCMKHQIAHMIGHGGGSIVNVSSLAGMVYVPESGAAYSAAKAGILQLTRWTAVTYADRGVRVNCISPGVTPTRAYFKRGPEAAAAQIAKMVERQALQRAIGTEEQANAVAWLCSDDAAMVTGHNIPVDGGWSAR